MERCDKNVIVFAEDNGKSNGFTIFLNFSGQREYLITHRHNGMIYSILKDGIRLPDLQRGQREMSFPIYHRLLDDRAASKRLDNNLRHLLQVIDEYIIDRAQCA